MFRMEFVDREKFRELRERRNNILLLPETYSRFPGPEWQQRNKTCDGDKS